MGKIIRSNIDFLYVKGNRLTAHKLPIILPPTGTYYLTYNVTFRQLVSGCLGFHVYEIDVLLYLYVFNMFSYVCTHTCTCIISNV